uniref:Cytochrome P450 n=1 Tax=Mycena chlorophos TaxID=658473 RepID=A0ABQ0L5E4_MYCCL|nr:predicted protein [Mycena chlorophos]
MLPKELLVGTITLGLVNHAYLKRYEPKTAHWPLASLLLQPFALAAALRFLLPSSGISLTTTTVFICTNAFLSTLVVSIVAYRLSPWHRLAHIPGPMHRKVTKLFTVVEAVMGRRHLVLKDLHERSVNDVLNDVTHFDDAVTAILEDVFSFIGTDPVDLADLFPGTVAHILTNTWFFELYYFQETLRLYPVVPSGVGRRSPTGSALHVGGALIPGDTSVLVPMYVLQRSPANFFPVPEKFDPERWLRGPAAEDGIVHNAIAFIPFSYGPANCATKNLAWKELMSTAVLLLKRYEMKLVDVQGGKDASWGESVRDYYISQGRALMVEIALREYCTKKTLSSRGGTRNAKNLLRNKFRGPLNA